MQVMEAEPRGRTLNPALLPLTLLTKPSATDLPLRVWIPLPSPKSISAVQSTAQ